MAATALITGASGLIGSWMLKNWDLPDLEPIALDRAEVDLLEPGVIDYVVAHYRPEVVVHLAWSGNGIADYRHSVLNAAWLRASLNLREATRGVGARFLATGTVVDDVAGSADEYARSKVSLRTALSEEIQNRSIAWLRPFYVFDSGQGRPELVGLANKAATTGVAVALRSPNARHDFVHASDVGRAIVEVVRHDVMGSIDIGSGTLHTVTQLVEACGASWRPTGDPRETLTHSEQSARIDALTTIGWSANATEEFFAGV